MEFLTALDKQNDDYCTPPETWEHIAEYLPKGFGVEAWEAFFNPESTSAQTLRDLGCKVVCEHVDFFNTKLGLGFSQNGSK